MKTTPTILVLLLATTGLLFTACIRENLAVEQGEPAVISLSLSNI